VKISLETCRAAKEIINYPTQLHLIGHFRILHLDAREHEFKIYPTFLTAYNVIYFYHLYSHNKQKFFSLPTRFRLMEGDSLNFVT
jgi:hypothetical protein